MSDEPVSLGKRRRPIEDGDPFSTPGTYEPSAASEIARTADPVPNAVTYQNTGTREPWTDCAFQPCKVRGACRHPDECHGGGKWRAKSAARLPSDEKLHLHATLLANGSLLAKKEIEWRAKELAQAWLARSSEAKKVWLWKNFVDGRPEYWAFDNPYPCHPNGDPITLGEPCGYAIVKQSIQGRHDVPEEKVIEAIKRASTRSATAFAWVKVGSYADACDRFGGDGVRSDQHATGFVYRVDENGQWWALPLPLFNATDRDANDAR